MQLNTICGQWQLKMDGGENREEAQIGRAPIAAQQIGIESYLKRPTYYHWDMTMYYMCYLCNMANMFSW